MNTIIYTILIILSTHIKAQNCGTGSILLTTQTEVDNFISNYNGTCNRIEFNLFIEGSSITDISGLSFLDVVSNGLYIRNSGISDLAGLENLSQTNFIRIQNNPNLLTANLPSITNNGSFYFTDNASLSEVNMPAMISSITGRLEIINNPNLSTINIPNIFGKSHHLIIENNPLLIDLDFLLNITSIGSYVTIQNNSLLNSCCFLENYLDGYLIIQGIITLANNLTDCNSLTAIDAACNIRDMDADGINDDFDNCPTLANASQVDSNNNGIGDACENSASINTGNNSGGVGINTTNPHSILEIAEGDIFLNNIHRGVILKAANGKCFRYRPDEFGVLKSKAIECPDN